jgi:hypothetical protein
MVEREAHSMNFGRRFAFLFAILGCVFSGAPPAAAQPSFDCRKASLPAKG